MVFHHSANQISRFIPFLIFVSSKLPSVIFVSFFSTVTAIRQLFSFCTAELRVTTGGYCVRPAWCYTDKLKKCRTHCLRPISFSLQLLPLLLFSLSVSLDLISWLTQLPAALPHAFSQQNSFRPKFFFFPRNDHLNQLLHWVVLVVGCFLFEVVLLVSGGLNSSRNSFGSWIVVGSNGREFLCAEASSRNTGR